jgi:hypothetical protein
MVCATRTPLYPLVPLAPRTTLTLCGRSDWCYSRGPLLPPPLAFLSAQVVVNLYPFRATVTRSPAPPFEEGVENIDIGGPAMIRAAAKNHGDVTVIVDPADYSELLSQLSGGGVSAEFRKKMAWKAYQHTASYDAQVKSWLVKVVVWGGGALGRVKKGGSPLGVCCWCGPTMDCPLHVSYRGTTMVEPHEQQAPKDGTDRTDAGTYIGLPSMNESNFVRACMGAWVRGCERALTVEAEEAVLQCIVLCHYVLLSSVRVQVAEWRLEEQSSDCDMLCYAVPCRAVCRLLSGCGVRLEAASQLLPCQCRCSWHQV